MKGYVRIGVVAAVVIVALVIAPAMTAAQYPREGRGGPPMMGRGGRGPQRGGPPMMMGRGGQAPQRGGPPREKWDEKDQRPPEPRRSRRGHGRPE